MSLEFYSIYSIVNDISGDNKDIVKFNLDQSVWFEIGENVELSRRLEKYRFIIWDKALEVGEII